MIPTDDLFQLIKSMSKSEKRFFKLYSGAQKKDKKYVLLFSAIEKQKSYDEKKLRTIFSKENFTKQFPVAKSDVYTMVLKNLSLFHSSRTLDFKLREALNQMEVLFFKGLFDQCLKIIKRQKKIAEQSQKYSILIEILRWERRIWSLLHDNLSTLVKCAEENAAILQELLSLNKHQLMVTKVWLKVNKRGKARVPKEKKEFQALFDTHLGKVPVDKGWETQWQYWISVFMYYRAVGNYKKAYDAIKNAIVAIESIPVIIKEEVHKYITTLGNVALVLQELGRTEECFYYTRKLRSFVQQKEFSFYLKIQTRALILAYSIELDVFIANGTIDEAIRLVPSFEKIFEEYGNEISEYHKVGIYQEIASTFIIAGNYKKALTWINKTLNGFSDRLDLQPAARLMNIIIHYELGNIHTLDTIIHSTEHFLKRKEKLYEFEKNILNNLKKLQYSNDMITRSKTLQHMKKSIKEIFSDEYGKIALEYFDISVWIESKLQNKPMSELLKK
jgi:tetratricopeptide (TPR) repeat protein